jgi:SynChlorMet cassette radical SAM/SPASM protein ScmF
MVCNIDQSNKQISQRKDTKLDLPEGVPPLTSLYMYISGSCNLACRHCWITPTHQPGGNSRKQIRLEYVRKAIREARPLGLQTVKLTGGEPTLHTEFRELVSILDDEGLAISIETNGTLIDHALAKFMKQREHISFISVSLDGVDAETHEDLRGVRGSFEQAITGIRNLVKHGFRPQLICTLHQGNVSQVGAVIKLAGDLGCGSVKFNHVQQVGRGEKFADEQGLGVAEIINCYQRIEKDLRNGSEIPVHFDIPFAFYSIRKLLDDSLATCSVRNILGLLAGGELSLCGIGVTVPELIYGHMGRDSLSDVWCNSSGLIQLREQVPAKLEGTCAQCLHRDLCQGACVANNFHSSGRINAPYQFCQKASDLGLFPQSRKREFSVSSIQMDS